MLKNRRKLTIPIANKRLANGATKRLSLMYLVAKGKTRGNERYYNHGASISRMRIVNNVPQNIEFIFSARRSINM